MCMAVFSCTHDVCVLCASSVLRGQKRAQDPLEWGLQSWEPPCNVESNPGPLEEQGRSLVSPEHHHCWHGRVELRQAQS